jgi:prepilin-type processing-associated H-X9-DG protein
MIELLCVICICVMLMSILVPCLSLVSERARRTQCANNLHNLGLAVNVYITDCRGWLPSAEPRNREPVSPLHWFMNDRLMEYVGVTLAYDEDGELLGPKGKESILICPNDPHPMETRPRDGEPSVEREYGLSYGMNGTFGLAGRPDHTEYRRFSKFKNPSQTCLLADCWGTSLGPGVVLYHSCVQDNLVGRHQGFANVVYLDAHVRAIRHEEIPMGFERRYEPFWSAVEP